MQKTNLLKIGRIAAIAIFLFIGLFAPTLGANYSQTSSPLGIQSVEAQQSLSGDWESSRICGPFQPRNPCDTVIDGFTIEVPATGKLTLTLQGHQINNDIGDERVDVLINGEGKGTLAAGQTRIIELSVNEGDQIEVSLDHTAYKQGSMRVTAEWEIDVPPTATPTPTITATPVITPTATATLTATPVITPTATVPVPTATDLPCLPGGTVNLQAIEDTNGNGSIDAGDTHLVGNEYKPKGTAWSGIGTFNGLETAPMELQHDPSVPEWTHLFQGDEITDLETLSPSEDTRDWQSLGLFHWIPPRSPKEAGKWIVFQAQQMGRCDAKVFAHLLRVSGDPTPTPPAASPGSPPDSGGGFQEKQPDSRLVFAGLIIFFGIIGLVFGYTLRHKNS